jgi:SAM-dependent methyltransferase
MNSSQVQTHPSHALSTKLPSAVKSRLRCPICQSQLAEGQLAENRLQPDRQTYTCTNPSCPGEFPVVNGVPVLINEQASVFKLESFVTNQDTFFKHSEESLLKKLARSLTPSISQNISARRNYQTLLNLLLQKVERPRVLVIGGSILGDGMEAIAQNPNLEFVDSDVSFGERTMLVCDAHNIPFADQSFDAIIAQAVLEHVVDPHRCVAEIHRVLKPDGIVYAETPFMQQVHGGPYDFTRFTFLGHRRLFRHFQEVESGASCGPGMALAWSLQYFLMSLTTSKVLRGILKLISGAATFYLPYVDYFLIRKPATLDAASAYYFIGQKVDGYVLSDQELLRHHRGVA